MNQLILAIILSLLPVSELRVGLPVALNYAIKNNLPVFPVFFLVVFFNILVIFFVFFFLDFLHKRFMKIAIYKKFFNFYIAKIRKKADKFEKQYYKYGFLALTIFVAIPLPGTGAWTGCLIAWFLGLERKKSILAISLGVFLAGVIVLLGSFGIFSLAKLF